MTKKHERPVGLFIFVQAMGICAMLISASAIIGLGIVPVIGSLIVSLQEDGAQAGELIFLLASTVCLGLCLLWLLAEFVGMCSRVRRETAFTAANVRALGHIGLAFFLGGLMLLVLGEPLMDWLLMGLRGMNSPLWHYLPAFAAWTAALLVRAIQVLLRRAVDMQTESDLTV